MRMGVSTSMKPRCVEVVADELDGAVAQAEVIPHSRAAEVEVAVAHAEQLVDLRLLGNVEGGRLGRVEDGDAVGDDLDLSGGQRGVRGALGTGTHTPAHLYDPFAAERLGAREGLGHARLEYGLHEPRAVAQVDEDESAVVAAAMDPPG